jgi:DinB superfamily
MAAVRPYRAAILSHYICAFLPLEARMATTKPLDPHTIAGLLAAQLACVKGELQSLPAEACRWNPAEGEWSVNEALGHIIESERRGFNGRIRMILAEETPTLKSWDQEVIARERRDAESDPAALLREFQDMRTDSIALVEGLRPEQLGRKGVHEQVGEISVSDLLHEWVHHDRNHVKQLLSVVQEYVWPQMGNCRRFAEFD